MMQARIDHNRLYITFFAFSAVLTALNAAGLWYWHWTVGMPVGHLAARAVPWVAALNAAYCAAMVVTLWSRRYRPRLGRRLTRILNWALLPALVCGTALGLYGLLKVDRSHGSGAH
jgi:hypothetical protein